MQAKPIVFCAMAGAALMACERGTSPTEGSTTPPNPTVATTPDTTEQAQAQREQYEREASDKLDRLAERVDKAKETATDNNRTDRVAAFQKPLTDVRAKLEGARAELKVLKSADRPAWASTRAHLDQTIVEIENSLDQLQSRAVD